MARTVLTIGTFDGLHVGHLELLAGCRDLVGPDGFVVVGVNTDDFVDRYKGRPPARPYRDRVEVLRSIRTVDVILRNVGCEDSSVLIDVVGPDVLAIGDDWLDRHETDPEARYLRQLGIDHDWLDSRRLYVEYLPRTRGVSSSRLRDQ